MAVSMAAESMCMADNLARILIVDDQPASIGLLIA